jgi:uncharacterized membrane protein YbhN (UPF0104 family)
VSTPARRRRGLLRLGLLLVAVVFAVLALHSQWGDVRDRSADLSVGHVAAAAAFLVASLVCTLLAWRAVLAGLGDDVPLRPAARIFFLGQLGKYVPGSVWALVSQMELGRAYGLRRNKVATAGVLGLAISLAVALVLALLVVPATLSSGSAGYAAFVLLLIPLAVVLHPKVLTRLLQWGLRVLRRPELDAPLTGRMIVEVAVLSTLNNVLLGLGVWQLAVDLGGHGWALVWLCVGTYSLAASAGVIAIPLPAGAGLREAILVLLLAPKIGTPSATVVAIVARLLATVADVGAAGLASLSARRHPVAPAAD